MHPPTLESAQAPDAASKVLLAARALFVEEGYAATSMRQLAARVGVQPGSLYHHVASKQDLLLDVLMDIATTRLDAWRYGAYTRNVVGYLRFRMDRQAAHPDEEALLRYESRHLTREQRLCLETALAQLQQPLRDFLAKDRRPGRFVAQDQARSFEALLALIDAANDMRRRPVPVEASWIRGWIEQTSRALLDRRRVANEG